MIGKNYMHDDNIISGAFSEIKNKTQDKHKFVIITDVNEYPEIEKLIRITKVLDTHMNLKYLLNKLNVTVKFNLMTRQREVHIPGFFISNEDPDNHALYGVNYLATLNKMPLKNIDAHLDVIAAENAYHPIVECIKNNPWDGVKRLDDFCETIQCNNQEFANKIIKTWMVSAIAAAHSEHGFSSHGVLVLQGKQGIGKTRWFLKLDPINCHAVRDGIFLDPTYKDCVAQIARHWIVEIGELDATFNKSDIARIKSYITQEQDILRLAYARKATRFPRRTVFAATVNDENYLIDETGNRRYWTIAAKSINYQHDFDMKQVWAEVYQSWQEGALPYLEKMDQEVMNDINAGHEQIDPFKEKLLSFYDWDQPVRKELTTTQILEEMGFTKPTRSDAKRMGAILSKINGKKSRRSNGLNLHEVPARINVR